MQKKNMPTPKVRVKSTRCHQVLSQFPRQPRDQIAAGSAYLILSPRSQRRFLQPKRRYPSPRRRSPNPIQRHQAGDAQRHTRLLQSFLPPHPHPQPQRSCQNQRQALLQRTPKKPWIRSQRRLDGALEKALIGKWILSARLGLALDIGAGFRENGT